MVTGGKTLRERLLEAMKEISVVSCSQFPVHKLFKTVPVSVYIFF